MPMNSADHSDYDVVIIGGGFYGCCLALYLRSLTNRILIIEAADELLTHASRVNQARIHTGFHYPRSFVTALRSRQLQSRFVRDFSEAVQDDFTMLYAVARWGSKVSAGRFLRMFEDMGAPIEEASAQELALFDTEKISGVYRCHEYAFDWTALRDRLTDQLCKAGIPIWRGVSAERVRPAGEGVQVELDSGRSLAARRVFNVTYANLNALLQQSELKPLALKHELTEIALTVPPADLAGKAVTVMDGPFFSCMPYPSEKLYSLTHVRYTPHYSWVDQPGRPSAMEVGRSLPQEPRWRHMMLDSARFMPCLKDCQYDHSLFEVKTVLMKSEKDDGRPILLRRHDDAPGLFSILGAKIDNIYDLFEALPKVDEKLKGADDRHLMLAPL